VYRLPFAQESGALTPHLDPGGDDGGASAPHPRTDGIDQHVARAPWGEWSDQHLVLASGELRGDAYAELYRRHSSSVAASARMILGASPACEDVVTEVFASLWQAPERFDPSRGTLLTYLRLKARGKSIDLVRSERSRRDREHGAAALRVHEPAQGAIDTGLLQAETAQELHLAVARLPPVERAVVELAYFCDMTHRSVAHQLEVPEGTVKSRLHRGLSRLRAQAGLAHRADLAT